MFSCQHFYRKAKVLAYVLLSLIVALVGVFFVCNSYKFFPSKINSNMSIETKRMQLLNAPSRAYLHPEVEDYLKHHKVFISLTTSPKRIKHLAEIFSTLDLRNVEAILLAIPKIFARTGEHYVVPEALIKEYPKLRILRMEKDLGPITKLLPAAEYARKIDPQAMVITIDDDVLYPFGMINEMIHYFVLNDSVVGGMMYNLGKGVIAKVNPDNYPWRQKGKYAFALRGDFFTTNFFWHMLGLRKRQFVVGYGGVAYRVDWLDINKLKTLSQLNRDCFRSDDMVISYVLNARNIPIAKLSTMNYNINLIASLTYGGEKDALSSIDINEVKYLNCYNAMLKYDGIN